MSQCCTTVYWAHYQLEFNRAVFNWASQNLTQNNYSDQLQHCVGSNTVNQFELKAYTCKWGKVCACKKSFGFTSDWLGKRSKFFLNNCDVN